MSQIDVNEVELNGVKYIRKDSLRGVSAEFTGDLKIIILQRGWVMVGRLSKTGTDCVLQNAYVIREWGTTKGLGELAMEGPKSGTKLDGCGGIVEFDNLTVIATISCNPEKWKNYE